ncbi:MAG TPA: type 4a pilus biogenesis protein PilO [bacterium]|nr:type 4a pilus biogenesis protein PilO [bacterium]
MRVLLINIGKLKAAYKYGGLFAILLLIVLAYYITVYMPHMDTMESLFTEFTSKKAEFSKMVVLVRDRGQFMEEVEGLDRDLKVAISMLPDKKEIPALLKKLSDEAEKYGLEVYYFEPLAERRLEFYAEVPVSIKVRGSFHEVLGFFDSVNKLARIVNVSDLVMKADTQKNNEQQKKSKGSVVSAFSGFQPNKTGLDISFRATTYRFLTQAELGGANAK